MAHNPQKTQFLKALGDDIRRIRMSLGWPQRMLAHLALASNNWVHISQVERGETGMDMIKYLTLMWNMRVECPDHPAVALAKMLLPPDLKAGYIWDGQDEAT